MQVSPMGDFKKLDVWQHSSALARFASATAKRIFKRDPHLADQLKRSAAAVPAMIAEGSGLGTDRAYANKVSEAIGEVSEVENHAEAGFGDGVLTELEHQRLTDGAILVRRKLIGLRRTLRGEPRRHPPAPKFRPEP